MASTLHCQIDETIGWVSLQIDRLKAASVQQSVLWRFGLAGFGSRRVEGFESPDQVFGPCKVSDHTNTIMPAVLTTRRYMLDRNIREVGGDSANQKIVRISAETIFMLVLAMSQREIPTGQT